MNCYEKDRKSLLVELNSNADTGVQANSTLERTQKYGKNQFDEQKSEGIGKKILHNLREITTIILILAATISLIMGIWHDDGYIEFIVIMSIVIMNIILAIVQEGKAEKALSALKNLNSPTCIVLRDGKQQEIDSADVVTGDIIILKTGDMVPADARLIESTDLAVDESILTGESEPSEKDSEIEIHGKVAVAEQNNMVFSGCLVTAGRAKALVIAVGMKTQMGKIAGYLNDTQKLKTPLQTRLDRLSKTISVVAIVAAIVLFAVGFLQGEGLWDILFVAVALAVAAVPETLSLIVTLTLAHGVTEMAKKNALIRKLPAVETLGSTSVICTDKTGTLTQNRMSIKRLWQPDNGAFEDISDFNQSQMEFLNRFALVSNAVAEKNPNGDMQIMGDPTEASILRLLYEKGGNKEELEKQYPRVFEISFSSSRKMMTTVHKDPKGGYIVLTKGAFDRVPFENASEDKLKVRQDIHDLFASDAMRIIALGSKYITALPPEDKLDELEKELYFEGIIGIIDPPRPECAAAIAKARKASVRTVMITGDHAATAGAIAHQIGLISGSDKIITGVELSDMSDEALIENISEYAVYARVSPEDKIRIVEAWQEHGEVVSMTGDGVNDAPALKAADVGVAMGISGTDVAKSASDMILTDDNFSTIVDAVHKGRDVFSNIRKTIYFLLVCNFSEIIIMLYAQLIGWGAPVTPIMLLLINVIGDGIPGLFIAREKSDPRIMMRHPIGRNESLFEGLQYVMATQTIVFAVVTLIGYYIGTFVTISDTHLPTHFIGQTVSFLILGWTSILHIFTVRSRQSIFKRTLKDNPMLAISAIVNIVVFALIATVPPLANIFGMVAISLQHWLMVIGLSIVPMIVAEIGKFISNRSDRLQHRHRLVHHDAAMQL